MAKPVSLHKILLTFVLFITVFWFYNCQLGGNTLLSTASGKQLKIVVYDEQKADVYISGARVILKNTKTGKIYSKVTDSNGTAIFLGLDIGVYQVTISADGFKDEETNIVLDAPKELNIGLREEQPVNTISGTVTDAATNKPIVGALIEVRDLENATVFYGSARTDSSGEYIVYLKNLPPAGSLYLKVTASATNYGIIEKDPLFNIGTYIDNLDFELVEATGEALQKGNLTGVVKNKDGDLLENIVVYLKGNNYESTRQTNNFGVFSFTDLYTGKYLLVLTDANGVYQDYAQEVDLNEGLNTLTITLAKVGEDSTCEVRGIVTESGDESKIIQGATVGIILFEASHETQTDSSGKYEFLNLNVGKATLYAYKEGYKPYSETFDLIGGLNLKNISLERAYGDDAYLNFTVVENTSDEAVISGVTITIKLANVEHGTKEFTATNGIGFSYVQISSEVNYQVDVSADSYYPTSAVVNLKPGESKNLRIKLTPYTGLIYGIVTNKDNNVPIPSATVQIASSYEVFITSTNVDGKYSFNKIPFATYTVSVYANGYNSQSKDDVVITYNDPVKEQNFELEYSKNSQIVAFVYDKTNNNPIGTEDVTLKITYNSGASEELNYVGGGIFKLDSVTPEVEYTLMVIPTTSEIYNSTLEVFTLGIGETKIFKIALTPKMGKISGIVIDNSTKFPINGATVFLSGEASNSVYTTDNSGSFGFGNLKVGTYTISVSATNYNSQTKQVIVATDELNKFVTVELIPYFGTVSGIVKDKDTNEPIDQVSVFCAYGQTLTDTGGKFTIGKIPSGTVNLFFSKAGYNSASTAVTVKGGEISTLEISLEQSKGGISGIVKEINSGDHLASMSVFLTQLSIEVTTNKDGYFEFSNLREGNYNLLVYPSTVANISVKPTSTVVAVNKNATSFVEIEVEKIATPAVFIQVMEATVNVPIANATVSLMKRGTDEIWYATTDVFGNAQISKTTFSINFGDTYWFFVTKENYITYQSAVYGPVTQEVNYHKVFLKPVYSQITVEVSDKITKEKLPSVKVEIVKPDYLAGKVYYTSTSGVVLIDKVYSGEVVTVNASKDGYENSSASGIAGKDNTIEINLIPNCAYINGTVETTNDDALENVKIYDNSNNTLLCTSDKDGVFKIFVDLSAEAEKTLILRYELDNYEVTYKPVTVKRGDSVEILVRMSKLPTCTVMFKVTSTYEETVNDATIEIYGNNYTKTLVTVNGATVANDLEAGSYVYYVKHPSYESYNGNFNIESGSSVVEVVNLTRKTASIYGKAVLYTDRVSTVEITPLDNVVVTLSGPKYIQTYTTGSSGVYYFDNVPYDSGYKLSFMHKDYGKPTNEDNLSSFNVTKSAILIDDAEFKNNYWVITGTVEAKLYGSEKEIPSFVTLSIVLMNYENTSYGVAIYNPVDKTFKFNNVPKNDYGYYIKVKASDCFYEAVTGPVSYDGAGTINAGTIEITPIMYRITGGVLDGFIDEKLNRQVSVPAVTVEAKEITNNYSTTVISNTNGSFSVSVICGMYNIILADNSTFWKKATYGTYLVTDDVDITVLDKLLLYPVTTTATGYIFLDEDNNGVYDSATEKKIREAKNSYYSDVIAKVYYYYRGFEVSNEAVYLGADSYFKLEGVPVTNSTENYIPGVDKKRLFTATIENYQDKLVINPTASVVTGTQDAIYIPAIENASIGAWLCGRIIDYFLYHEATVTVGVPQVSVEVKGEKSGLTGEALTDPSGYFRIYIKDFPNESYRITAYSNKKITTKLGTVIEYQTAETVATTSTACNLSAVTVELEPNYGNALLKIRYDAQIATWEFDTSWGKLAIAKGPTNVQNTDWDGLPTDAEPLITDITYNYYNVNGANGDKLQVAYPGIDLRNFRSDIIYKYERLGYVVEKKYENVPGSIINLTKIPVGTVNIFVSTEGFYKRTVYWYGNTIGYSKDIPIVTDEVTTVSAAMMPIGINIVAGCNGTVKATESTELPRQYWYWKLSSYEIIMKGYLEIQPLGWQWPLPPSNENGIINIYSYPAAVQIGDNYEAVVGSTNAAWIVPHYKLLSNVYSTGEYGAYYQGTVVFYKFGIGDNIPDPPDPTGTVLFKEITDDKYYEAAGGLWGDFTVTAEWWVPVQPPANQ